jgi:hypothetical protein
VNDDELSDLSSLPPSPNRSRAPSLPVVAMAATLRHNLHTASSTDLAGREPVSKTRIERPANASRAQFRSLVDWDDHLFNSIKVR